MKTKVKMHNSIIIGAALVLASLDLFAAGPAGNFVLRSYQTGNDGYGDWSGENIDWGPGYPRVSVTVDTDESLIFGNGVQRQGMTDFSVIMGSAGNDNPEFIGVYNTDLAMNGILMDTGTMTIRYDFEFGTELVDIVLFDFDDTDTAQIQIFGIGGVSLPASQLELVAQGDLSLNLNAPGRPSSELSTPPSWDPETGTLTSQVSWNENRSFTVLRPRVPISAIQVTVTGTIPAPDPNSSGSLVLTALWATPRVFEITDIRNAAPAEIEITWTSLPGLLYRILGSSNQIDWSDETTVVGSPPPATHSTVTLPTSGSESRFFRIVYDPAANATGQVSVVASEVGD